MANNKTDDWEDVNDWEDVSEDDWEEAAEETKNGPGRTESLVRGAAQGAFLGFPDEAAGAVGAVTKKARGDARPIKDLYREERDDSRRLYKEAEEANPGTYLAGELGGGVATSFVPLSAAARGAKALTSAEKIRRYLKGIGAGMGIAGAQGAGYSEADTAAGVAEDAGASAVLGGAASAAAPLITAPIRAAKKIPKKVLSSVGGVHEKNIDAYLAGSERIKNAAPVDDIEEAVTSSFSKIKAAKEAAESSASAAEAKVADKYKNKLNELKSKSVPTSQADDLLASLDLEKAWQGDMSDKAYEALAASGVKFRKADLLEHIRQEALKIGAGKNRSIIGKEAAQAVADLKDMYIRAKTLPDSIDGPTLRNVLKQIRSDVSYGGPAGSFNTTANAAKKNISRGVSNALKSDEFGSPEYKKIMGEMAPRAESLEEMSQFFGTKEKALAALEAVASENTPRSKLLAEKLQRYASQTGNKKILDDLAEIREARGLLRESKTQDLTQRFFPDDVSEVSSLKDRAKEAAAEFEPARRLTPERAQGVIKNVGGPNARNVDVDALDYLGKRAEPSATVYGPGRNLTQEIKDRGVLDSFSKDATRGSKQTNMGIAIGNSLARAGVGGAAGGYASDGSSAGMGVGALFGALSGTYGPQMTKKVLDMYIKASPKDGSLLRKAANALNAARQRGPEALKVTQFLLLKQHPELKQLLETEQ